MYKKLVLISKSAVLGLMESFEEKFTKQSC
jgi:hypothetical protein